MGINYLLFSNGLLEGFYMNGRLRITAIAAIILFLFILINGCGNFDLNDPYSTPGPTGTHTDTPTGSTPTNTPTNTSTNSPTNTLTDTPTNTMTDTPTNTDSPTNTVTNTPTPTDSPTDTASNTPTPTDSPTYTATNTSTPTDSPTDTATDTPTPTNSLIDTATPTDSPTDTAIDTPTPTDSPTDTGTDTPTPTDSPTDTAIDTSTPTDSPTDTATDTPTPTDSPTDTATDTPTPTESPTDTATNTPTPTDSPTDTATDTPTPTDSPTDTATDTPTPTDSPTDTATDTPTETAMDTPTPTDSATPIDSPTPTNSPNSNLVLNPDFESGITNWIDWGNTTPVPDPANGVYAAQIGTGEGGLGQVIAGISEGLYYTLSGSGKVSPLSEIAYLGIDCMDDLENLLEGGKFELAFYNTQYAQQSLTFTPITGTTKVQVYIYKDPGVGGYAFIDNISFSLASAPTPSPSPAVNLILNPDFESDTTNWYPWGNITTTLDHQNGVNAVQIGSGDSGLEQIIAGCSAGTQYTLSGWGKLTDRTGNFYLGVDCMDEGESILSASTFDIVFRFNEYRNQSLTFTTVPNTTKIHVYICKDSSIAPDAYIDNISLTGP
ncbi:MAG: hypothetical protein JW969_08980 [Spirochaetales bacterium]|nr:hypothetical protein [Spirochaetales bacterium]